MSLQTDSQRIEGRDALRSAVIALIEAAQRELTIASATLEPALFNDQGVIETLKNRLLERRRMTVRLLISDPQPARRNAERLVALLRRLPSQFTIHQPGRSEHSFGYDLWVADDQAFVKREDASALYAVFGKYDPLQAKTYKDAFDQAWLRSVYSPEFRQLS